LRLFLLQYVGCCLFLAGQTQHGIGAELAADYQAGLEGNPVPSPTFSGWVAGSPSSDLTNFQSAAVSPDGATGYNAWRMLDNSADASQFITWNKTLTSAQHASAASNGWRLATRLRVSDPAASNGGANSVLLTYGNNAGKRWILFFDLNAAGQIVTTLMGGPTVTLTGVDAALPHEHQIHYNSSTGTAEYLVDGVSKVSAYNGTTGSYNGIQWGTGSSGGKGDGYWNSVSFVISDPPPPPVPVATLDPVSRSVGEGNPVTFTAAFTGTAMTVQWYKDTVAVGGSGSAVLTIPAVAPGDAGDYWCRASNASGSASTNTAALAVLTAAGGLVLNEFLAENDSGLRDADGEQSDWIEIRNTSTTVQSTSDFFLTDNAALLNKWALPAENLAPGGFLRVWASGKNRATAGAELHTNFSLKNNGGYLALVKPDLTVVTAFTYPQQFADDSYGLTVHQPALEKFFVVPTPDAINYDGQKTVKDGLTFSPLPGTFSVSTSVAVTADPLAPTGGTLRYSTDGRLPEFDSPVYSTALNFSASTDLRAAVVYPGERYGATASGAYLKLSSDVQAFTSPLPVMILSNHGAGAIPGVNARGPNGDGSAVTAVAMQAQSLLLLDETAGATAMSSTAVNLSRAGLKVRGSSSFSFAEKSYTLETWGERDAEERDVPLAGLPADADWVLYGPDPAQFDNTLIHNTVAYALARLSGFNAPRFKFVELFLDSGGDLTMADHRGLAILVEKPGRGKERVDFNYPGNDGTTGGWMINVDRMDSMTSAVPVPRHFHTAGPDRILQTPNDNARGYQGIQVPGGTGSGSGLTPANDDMPNFYHSFFNFESPQPENLTTAQRTVIQTSLRSFDGALYGAGYTDPVTGYWPHIDVENWAHHLLIHTYVKNQDAIVLSSFLHREKPSAPLRWSTVWDMDRSFDRNTTSGSTGNAALTWAHDRLYYRRLVTDPEFMQAYLDKWQDIRRGPWTNAAMTALVDAQVAEITNTVAARSGLTSAAWAANVATMKTWMTSRANAMDAQFTAPPVLSHPGGDVPAGFQLTITAAAGSLYFTTDGTDPRVRGGAAVGTLYSAPLAITVPTTIKVRARNGANWSGLRSATYFPPQDLGTLRVTEICYNPPSQPVPFVDGEEFEFLELKNTGAQPLNVSGLSFTEGITFTFPAGTTIDPGAFFILVRNPAPFAARFPACTPQGTFTDKLNDGGEILTLSQGADVVLSFAYDDNDPWRTEPDGSGHSLQRTDPAAPGYDVLTWTAALPTPCADLSLADSDSDGMADYWEPLHGFTVGTADGSSDADSDGATNAGEFIAGTDPLDGGSRMALQIIPAPAGQTGFEFQALAGKTYTVQTSADLQSWQTFQQVPAGPVTRIEQIVDTISTARKFYRAITPANLLVMAGDTGQVTLAPVFTNHMVLQRELPVQFWGTAPAGGEVTVTLGKDSVARFAGADGKWRLALPAQVANTTPQTVTVSLNGQAKVTLNDVLVGEVWLCAGQSNMEFRCDQEATWGTEQANASLPHVRLYNMGYAGQGIFGSAYPAATVSRQTPEDFYDAATWTACNATTVAPFSAVGYFFGKEILNTLNVPVGLINMSVGGSPAEAWTRRAVLPAALTAPGWTSNDTNLEPWCNGRALVQLGANFGTAPGDDMGPNHSFKPAFLWDSGPARLAPFAIRGVLWYQGESNALSHIGEAGVANPKWRVEQHETLFPLLVNDWRAQWGQGNFPFLVCQLSSISEISYDSDFWPEFRDYQRRATALLPNIGLAVTSNIGNASNVHPTNKRDVGKRLARWAQRYTYGDTAALPCPLPRTATAAGNTVTLAFHHAGTAMNTSNGLPPASFEIAGTDNAFQPATAALAGQTITVTSSVAIPAKIRYSWQPFGMGNVVNAAALPLSTFQLSIAP
jgi:sialate O-acetylesterase